MTQIELPTIGILGDGQLSMMMVLAYQNLGGKVFVFGNNDKSPASQFADRYVLGDSNSEDDLLDFFNQVDVVTLENEFLDSQLLVTVVQQSSSVLFPDPRRYGLIEDKLSENHFFRDQGSTVADFFEVKSEADLIDAPGYLKLAKGGYDGIGTFRVDNKSDALEVYKKIENSGQIVFEHTIDFQKELSMIVAVGKDDMVFYPMVETHQEQGTCRYVSYPAGVSTELEEQAQQEVRRIMQALDTRGLFAFEYFLTSDDRLVINESAPRPHNSGHITLDLVDCSQFENHMRAVAGLELKQPELVKDSAIMVNLLGTQNAPFDAQKLLSNIKDDNASTTLYGKQETRIKRKMGHINLWGKDQWQRARKLVDDLIV